MRANFSSPSSRLTEFDDALALAIGERQLHGLVQDMVAEEKCGRPPTI